MPHSNDGRDGRIAAVAHLSAAYALVDCAMEALAEEGITELDRYVDARAGLRDYADRIMEPYEIANVLLTVEEIIANQGFPATTGRSYRVTRNGRAEIIKAIVDVRDAGREDETLPERLERLTCRICGGLPAGEASGGGDLCTCEDEPSDEQLANRFGMEGGIGYDTTPDMRDEHDPSL